MKLFMCMARTYISRIKTIAMVNTFCYYSQEYNIRPGERYDLDIIPFDSFGKPTGFVFGFSQVINTSVFLTGRIARYLSLEQNVEVCTFVYNFVHL